jgi:subtilisin-like proprotein convertase family protein
MVSGVVALMLEANPKLIWRDIKHILATTAIQIDQGNQQQRPPVRINGILVEPGWITNKAGLKFHNAYGFGLVDATAAVEMAETYQIGQLGEFNKDKYPELASGDLALSLQPNTLYQNTINQSSNGVIEAVRVKLYVESNHISDLSVALVSPSGTRSVLLSPFNAIDSITGDYIDLSSNAFYGEAIQGDWTIEVYDHLQDASAQGRQNSSASVTRLISWSLKLYGRETN